MTINILLLIALVLAAVATAVNSRVLRAVIWLAVASAVLSVVMFRLSAPIAAVFELSVCAGLIPAIFITVIGVTRRLGPEDVAARKKEILRSFWYLPLILIFVGIALINVHVPANYTAPAIPSGQDVRYILWGSRQMDLIGQVAILLGGVFAVVILLMRSRDE